MDFARFIAPMSAETFRRDYYQRRPLHLKGADGSGEERRRIIDWARLNALLSVPSHWSEANLKLLLDSRPVGPEHYLSDLPTLDGVLRRADAAKVQMLLGLGASIVANQIEDIDLGVRQVTAMLGEEFSGRAGANAYASFRDVRAFDSHCDLHEVFAVQLDGRKSWRIYRNRAEAPVQPLKGPDAQAIIDSVKGPVLMSVDMEPGDLLYIPRGYYHDALASSESSLHLTFAVAPLDGRILFRMIEEMAIRDPDFREHLPDYRDGDGAALRARLEALAGKVGALIGSEMMADEVEALQRSLAVRASMVDPTTRPALDQLVRTAAPAEVRWGLAGATLRHAGGEEPLGVLAQAAEWALQQASFTSLQLAARYAWLSRAEVRRLVALLVDAGTVVKHRA